MDGQQLDNRHVMVSPWHKQEKANASPSPIMKLG